MNPANRLIALWWFFSALIYGPVSQTTASGQAGRLDPGFNPGVSNISAIVVQPDGKIVVAGRFTFETNGLIYHLARLEADGSIDSSFTPYRAWEPWEMAPVIEKLFILPGGRILAKTSDQQRLLMRFETNGLRDTTFLDCTNCFRLLSAVNFNYPRIDAIAIQPDGKILVGGNFFRVLYSNSYAWATNFGSCVARLLSDGRPDRSFRHSIEPPSDSFPEWHCNSLAVQADGKILVGGVISYAVYVPPYIDNYGLFRLGINGSLDLSFTNSFNAFTNPLGLAVQDYAIKAVQPDGKILLAAEGTEVTISQTQWWWTGVIKVIRVNPDRSRDYSFSFYPPSGSTVDAPVALTKTGKLFFPNPNLIRLNPDGSQDLSFMSSADRINDIVLQPDGKLLIRGSFMSIDDVARPGLARLLGETPCRFQSVQRLDDGRVKLSVAGESYQAYVIQSSSNCVNWIPVSTNSSTSGTFDLIDSDAPVHQQRYFRAVTAL